MTTTEHPTFKFYLDAHRYLRVNGLVGAWRLQRMNWHGWRIVAVE